MDYKKLSQVHDSVKGLTPVSVTGKSIVPEGNPLDALATSSKIADDTTRYIILDSVQIEKLMSMSLAHRKKFLSKLTDSQRRHVLSEMARIKDSKAQVKDSGFSTRLAYVLLDQQLSNYVYLPNEVNKKNLEQVFEQSKDVWSPKTVELYNSIIKNGYFISNDENDAALENFCSQLDECTLKQVLSVLDTQDISSEDFDVELPEVTAQAEEDAQQAFDSAEFDLTSAVQSAIQKFCSDSATYPQVYQTYLNSWAMKVRSIANTRLADSQVVCEKVKEALDKIEELPLKDADGNIIPEKQDMSIIQLVNSALEKYAEGDDSELQDLANKSVQVTEPQLEGEGTEGEDPTIEDSVISFAKSVLDGTVSNQVVDSLKSALPALTKYNFKVTDCDLCRGEACQLEEVPVNIPLTHDEYCNLCPAEQTPDYFNNLLNSVPHAQCPYVKEYSIPEGAPYIIINGCQKYYPYNCTVEELSNQIQQQPQQEWHRIVSSNCCPLEDALHMAAITNNLSFVDDVFYKKHLTDHEWAFDTIPACIAEVVTSPGSIRMKRPKDSSDNVISIFGQEFVLL